MAIKKITDIYPGYFQKSKVFLYPALNHKRGTGITPIETYLSWENYVNIADLKLVCIYYLRDDDEFNAFEEKCLLNNPLFEDYKEIAHDKAAYIFNFEKHAEDFHHVIAGRYSEISENLKSKIREHFGASTANYAFVHSYLYPGEHIEKYAEFLTSDPKDIPDMVTLLSSVGELCSKPNLEKEMLKVKVKALDLKNLS